VPPEFSNIKHAEQVYDSLQDAYTLSLPTSSDTPACKKLVDEGGIDKTEKFLDSADAETVRFQDIGGYARIGLDAARCASEAQEKGLVRVTARWFRLNAMLSSLEYQIQYKSDSRLLPDVRAIEPGKAVRVEIQVVPSPNRRVPPPQTCSGTVFGEGSLKMVNWECF
jgi:hypothetical protein